jgi:hypothetical protein
MTGHCLAPSSALKLRDFRLNAAVNFVLENLLFYFKGSSASALEFYSNEERKDLLFKKGRCDSVAENNYHRFIFSFL